MDKWTIAKTLDEIARYLELSEPNPFKVRAFEKAARKIESLDEDVEKLVLEGRLVSVPGIGKAIGPIVSELVTSGRSQYLEDLRSRYPAGIFELLRVPALGLRKIGTLHDELGVASLDELEEAAKSGRIAKIRGFGAKTEQKILQGIATARQRSSKYLLPFGLEVGASIRERLAQIDAIDDAEITGSVRRRLEVIRNVNLAIATSDAEGAIAAIRKRAVLDRIEALDDATLRGFARNEIEVLLHLGSPGDFGASMLVSTGSREFVDAFQAKAADAGIEIRARALYRNGRHVNAASEKDVFTRAGIPFVSPERREDGTDLRRKKRTPLIEPDELRGTFHVHTTFSDGRNTVREMLAASRERGFEYVGISDHSPNAFYANGLTTDDLPKQHAEIEAEEKDVQPMRVFRGTEADILNDGSIDYGHEVLRRFDFVVASIHSRFGMAKDEMTERMLRALDDPFVTFLGHLTGRLLLAREGYTVDFDHVFDRAAERGVMIEINGNPNRLDLDWRHIKRAVDRGVVLSIHPDAHSTSELSHVISGTWVARKGGLAARQIFNTRPREEVAEWLEARRSAAVSKTQ